MISMEAPDTKKKTRKARKKLPPLSDTQSEFLLVLHDAIEGHPLKRCPTHRRLAIITGKARGTISELLGKLRDFGCVESEPYVNCSTSLTETGYAVVGAIRKA